MSRVFQRNQTWFADYSDERGQRIRQRLKGIKGRRLAELELAELVAQVRRREIGLEPIATRTNWTVWQLLDWWLKERCPVASVKNERQRLEKHVKSSAVAGTPAAYATASQFEQLFSELERAPMPRTLAAGSINHLRAKMRTAFERARREGKYNGRNPLLDTKLRAVPRRLYETISADEVPRVLAQVPPQWRGFLAAAVYLGLRKGEIAGLRKSDVDVQRRIARVWRSYERQTTKGGHGDLLPIPEPMMPYLEAAMKTPGPLLFGNPKGGMRTKESDPHLTLRRALRDAGIVTAYVLSCRPCKADKKARPYSVTVGELPQPLPKCPDCERQTLWVKAIPRHMRFHDLRHSTATILLRDGVDAHRVMKLMRHQSFETTQKTYAHLIVDDLRQAQQAFQHSGTDPAPPEVQPKPTPKGAVAK